LEKNNVCTSFGNTNNFGQFGLKKNVDDKTCKYCNKTFKYPCRLLQHMKAKNNCNDTFLTANNSVPAVNDSVLTVNDSVLTVNDSVLTVKEKID